MSKFIHPHFVSSNVIGKSGEKRLIVTVATKQKAFLLSGKKAYETHKNNRAFLSLAGTIQRSNRAVLLALLPRLPRLPSFPVTY